MPRVRRQSNISYLHHPKPVTTAYCYPYPYPYPLPYTPSPNPYAIAPTLIPIPAPSQPRPYDPVIAEILIITLILSCSLTLSPLAL